MPKLKMFSFHTEILSQTICVFIIIPACAHMEMTGKDKKKYTLWIVNASCQLRACLFVCPKPLYASSTIISCQIWLSKLTYFVYDICLKLAENAAKNWKLTRKKSYFSKHLGAREDFVGLKH